MVLQRAMRNEHCVQVIDMMTGDVCVTKRKITKTIYAIRLSLLRI